MNELTIEQRAQRYEEALERAKKWYNAPNVDKIPTYGNRVIEEMFPELKESDESDESEDEGIRKELIDFIYDKTDTYELREKSNSWLAWLEKQSEQKHADKVEPKFKVGDKVYSLMDRFECTIESIDETTYYGDTTNFDIKDQDNWELVQQKPVEWSEEDKKMFVNIKACLRNANKDYSAELTWLKSLKQKTKE